MLQYVELVSLISGSVYVILQILQKRWMWYLSLLSCATALAVALCNRLWGTSALNVYMMVMDVVGIVKWNRMEKATASGSIHIVKMSSGAAIASAVIAVAGSAGIFFALKYTADPHPLTDSLTFVLSIIASWWLASSYIEQWFLWFAADLAGTVMFFSQGLVWMGILYAMFTLSCVAGYVNWKNKGQYILS